MTDGPLTVTEGGEPGYIDIVTTLSPEYFCVNRTAGEDPLWCVVHVWGYIELIDTELTCYGSGDQVSQAVLGWLPDYPADWRRDCGLYITKDNWMQTLRIPITAMLDGVADGTQYRTSYIHHQLKYQDIAIYDWQLKSIDVS